MKKLIVMAVLLIVYSGAYAQSDYSVTWQLTGLPNVNSITVDLNIGTNFVPANGGLSLGNGLTAPVTGTCFITAPGGIFCSFVMTQGLSGILEIGSNLNGTWKTFNVLNQITESGVAILDGIE